MPVELTIECEAHFRVERHGRKRMQPDAAPAQPRVVPGVMPRVSRLMALAIRFDMLVQAGEARDYADLARLGHVTRARMTQIMNLLLLAPDIQEEILFLPRVRGERETISERQLRPITAVAHWGKQRQMWKELRAEQPDC